MSIKHIDDVKIALNDFYNFFWDDSHHVKVFFIIFHDGKTLAELAAVSRYGQAVAISRISIADFLKLTL